MEATRERASSNSSSNSSTGKAAKTPSIKGAVPKTEAARLLEEGAKYQGREKNRVYQGVYVASSSDSAVEIVEQTQKKRTAKERAEKKLAKKAKAKAKKAMKKLEKMKKTGKKEEHHCRGCTCQGPGEADGAHVHERNDGRFVHVVFSHGEGQESFMKLVVEKGSVFEVRRGEAVYSMGADPLLVSPLALRLERPVPGSPAPSSSSSPSSPSASLSFSSSSSLSSSGSLSALSQISSMSSAKKVGSKF